MTLPPSVDDDGRWVTVASPGITDVALPGDDPDPDDAPRPVTLERMLATGATYRRLDYWTRRGYLNPEYEDERDRSRHSGYARRWTQADLLTADLLVRLTAAGFTLEAAARIAADAVKYRVTSFSTEEGIRISWTPRRPGTVPVA